MDKQYLIIDLKTFYASVECAERGLDPFKTNLVVADASRGKGAICLAITPKLKAMGIHNRCRLYEIPDGVEYIAAMPRMKKYMEYSARIYQIYLCYFSEEDIHPYSIDEMFIDVTEYLKLYNTTAEKLAKALMRKIYNELHITATAGIGTNLFLAKIALDIYSKHVKSNIGILNEETFREKLWYHKPITDFWMISTGTAKRLQKFHVECMRDILSVPEDLLYKEFGVNAEIIIDHAKGIEPVTIKDIHNYKRQSKSISQSQLLHCGYNYTKTRIVLSEMVESLCLDLVRKKLVSNTISLYVGYRSYPGTGGSKSISILTNAYTKILPYFQEIYDKTTLRGEEIVRLGIGFGNVYPEDEEHLDLFTSYEDIEKERNLSRTINSLKDKYGKNSVLKAVDLVDGATQRQRNCLIGGHNAETEDAD